MKRTVIFCLFVLLLATFAQAETSDVGRVTMKAYMPDRENIPPESKKLIQTKLSQLITNNGISDNDAFNRFVLTAKVNVVSKDIVVGPPQRISQKLDVTLMIGDVIEDKVYESLTIPVIGIGQSEEKAFMAAFKNIKSANSELRAFMERGKEKIVAYYQDHCEEIMKEAKLQASQQKYTQAIYTLSLVPNVCSECYEACLNLSSDIYTQMIDAEGASLLNQAQSVWAEHLDKKGAEEAVSFLSRINFAASCQPQAEALMKEITTQMKKIDQREWAFKIQQYQDRVEKEKREWEQHVKEYQDQMTREERNFQQRVKERDQNVATERMRINAYRDVAVEYARNQPKEVYYTYYNNVILW